MEFQGTVVKIMPENKGTSARGDWHRQDVIFEINDGSQYTRRVAVVFFNKAAEVQALLIGTSYNVSFNLESREFNDRWYTDVRAWRVTPVAAVDAQAQPAAQPQAAPVAAAPAQPVVESGTDEVDDLPF